jgi:hypothetical protein
LQPPARPEFRSAGFSSDGKRLLVAGADGLRMYDTQTAIAVGPPMAIVDIRAAGFSVDGKHVVARSPTGSHSWPLPDPAMPSGEAWRYWLNRHTAIDRAADGTLRFLRRLEWKGTLGEPRP